MLLYSNTTLTLTIIFIFPACAEFTYGDTVCDKNCSCVRENTDFCNNVNGQCICKPGWTGRNCSEDVNECLNVKVCPENSDCVNSDGSYRCSCHRGYAFNVATGLCDGKIYLFPGQGELWVNFMFFLLLLQNSGN